jgi:L-lactate utilization protein LutC
MERDVFLDRLRRAVAEVPATPHPGTFDRTRSRGDLVDLLGRSLTELQGDQRLRVAADRAGLVGLLREELRGHAPEDILWEGEVSRRDHAAGVASGVAALAASGTVICDLGDPDRGLASLLCDHSLLVVARDQLYPDVLAWSQSRAARERSGYLVHITGTSRTADIEKTLVMPAHGPGRLTVVLAPPGAGLPGREEVLGPGR